MISRHLYPFFPEKILRTGLLVLGGGALVGGASLLLLGAGASSPYVSISSKNLPSPVDAPLSFSLVTPESPLSLPLPHLERDLSFSFAPPRPDGSLQKPPLSIRLAGGAQSKRIFLPSRVDLCYQGQLCFSEVPSPFWVELTSLGASRIEAKVCIATASEPRIEGESFVATAQESPIQSAQEFGEGTPFRALAEGRWGGRDLFRERFGTGALAERIEMGPADKPYTVDLLPGDWISWFDGRWNKIASLAEGKERPIARIVSAENRSLLFEGWDLEGHVRLSLPLAPPPPLKLKVEELFSAVRVRSEKQISCMLEKQCLILRTGDWVFKGDRRWKILRRPEEREAYLNGASVGELFVFDRIETKGGQKVVQGLLFNAARSVALPIEIGLAAQKKNPPAHGTNPNAHPGAHPGTQPGASAARKGAGK